MSLLEKVRVWERLRRPQMHYCDAARPRRITIASVPERNPMAFTLPDTAMETLDWPWERWQPAYTALADAPLDAETLESWLAGWTRLSNLINEASARLSVAANADTTDA